MNDTPETDHAARDSIVAVYETSQRLERERDEWRTALLRVHKTGRGTPDEMAQDILDGIECAGNAIREQAERISRSTDRHDCRLCSDMTGKCFICGFDYHTKP